LSTKSSAIAAELELELQGGGEQRVAGDPAAELDGSTSTRHVRSGGRRCPLLQRADADTPTLE